jgi:glycerophosphoryl diester phosphodiesterase
VLAHDEQVGALEIAATKSQTLATQHAVPTLAELVAWAAACGVSVMADMKVEGDGVEEAVIAALESLPVSRKLVPGAGPESRARFRVLDPTLPLSLSHPGPLDEAAFEALLPQIDTVAVTWHQSILSPERVARLQERGLRVFAWTVDDPERLQQLLDWGVDGVISNNTKALQALKVAYGG